MCETFNAVAKWPAAGQGFKITKSERQSDVFLKFKESKEPIPTQAIQKSCTDRESNI